jgi:hypothetical protein
MGVDARPRRAQTRQERWTCASLMIILLWCTPGADDLDPVDLR